MINPMVEISKEVKIILYIDIIAAIIYAVQYLIIPDILFAGGTLYNPHMTRLWGGTIVVLLISALIALKRGELETLNPIWEFVILWWIMTLILNFAALTYMPYTPTEVATAWRNIIVVIILTVVNMIFYNRAGK